MMSDGCFKFMSGEDEDWVNVVFDVPGVGLHRREFQVFGGEDGKQRRAQLLRAVGGWLLESAGRVEAGMIPVGGKG